jgi:glutamate 5-kinase
VTAVAPVRAVVKIGSSSIAGGAGGVDLGAVQRLCEQLATARRAGHSVVLVSSGAIAAGMALLEVAARPTDMSTLQALAAVGQPRLMERYAAVMADHGVRVAQVLLTSDLFAHRGRYVQARDSMRRLLELGVLPIVNENDAVADDEIRYGDNDRLAALVSHLVRADVLVLLTDTPGLYTADPRRDADASLIEEIVAVDEALERAAGGTGSAIGSGGMASKLAAAKIAAWSGVRAVIAAADRPGVIAGALAGETVGTTVLPRAQRLGARKLWIAFAQGSSGRVVVDAGARTALVDQGRSLLPAGVRSVEGDFEADDPVEIVADGTVFAKGLVRVSSAQLRLAAGRRTAELPEGLPHEVVHRDDLVVLP